MKTKPIQLLLAAALCVVGHASAQESANLRQHIVWDNQPATKWMDGYVVGSGRHGAVPFGGYPQERLVLNDMGVWVGRSTPHLTTEKAAEAIPKIREALFAGKYTEALKMCYSEGWIVPRAGNHDYQPIGELKINYDVNGKSWRARDYRRSLSLNEAVATSEFTGPDNNRLRQEVIVSEAANAIIVRIESTNDMPLALSLGLDRFNYFESKVLDARTIAMSGVAQYEGAHFGTAWQTAARVVQDQGESVMAGNLIHVRNTKGVTIFIATSTDYDIDNPLVPLEHDRLQDCLATLAAVEAKPYAEIKAENIARHQSYFNRATVDLGTTPEEVHAQRTADRLQRVRTGEKDPDLLEDMFQMGRYLLINSSRSGNLPANLTGVWQGDEFPVCWSDMHFNINVQQNYWPAELTNLSEMHLPLIEFVGSVSTGLGREAAKKLNCRGFTMKTEQTAWKDADIAGYMWVIFAHSGGWACQHVMEHYYFTQDKEYLRNQGYPILAANVAFCLDWLVENPHTGQLVSGPSGSPEHGFFVSEDSEEIGTIEMGDAISQQITHESFVDFLAASKALGIEDDLTKEVTAALANLQETQIAKDGRMMEWRTDFREHEKGHRHFSHLYGLYPGCQFTEETPEYLEAARQTMAYRIEHHSANHGWGRGWVVNLRARLQEGDKAHDDLHWLMHYRTRDNLLHNEGQGNWFFMDGNGTMTSGIAELLMQSQGADHVMRLLPALPAAWPSGSFDGLCARGGFVIDLQWQDAKPTKASVYSRAGAEFRLKSDAPVRVTANGAEVPTQSAEGQITFPTEQGKTYEIIF